MVSRCGCRRNRYSAEEKIRSAEHSIVEHCRREGLAESLYYASSKEFVEAGKRHLIRRWRRRGHSDPSRESRCRHCSACLQCPITSIRAPHQPFDFSPNSLWIFALYFFAVACRAGDRRRKPTGELRLAHSQFGKFRHVTDHDGSRGGLANSNGRFALPKWPHGANLSVQSSIIRGMPVEALSAIRGASQCGLFSRGGGKAANLVNVHIHQFQPGGTVVDAAALAQFQEQWATYRKLVESDCLAHRAVSGLLRETLNGVFTSPFCFLDIACGDASTMKAALRGTQVRRNSGRPCPRPSLNLPWNQQSR